MRSQGLLIAILLQAAAWCSVAQTHPLQLDENQPYGRLTNAYTTPHVAWANPAAGGAIKLLALAPEWSQRETVELAQRLQIEYTPWMPLSFNTISRSDPDPAFAFFLPTTMLAQDLLVKAIAGTYDVVIVGKLDWQMLPPKQRFALLEKVHNGMGLVYVNPPAAHKELDIVFGSTPDPLGVAAIADNLPLSILPRLQAIPRDTLVKAVTFGKGRVVVLNYQEEVPSNESSGAGWPCFTPQWNKDEPVRSWSPLETLPPQEWVAYEYYQALVIRAVRWAAHKDSPVRLGAITLPATLAWGEKGTASVAVANAPAGAKVRAVVRHAEVYTRVTPLPTHSAATQVLFSLPNLLAGTYILDLWVVEADGKTVHTWGSAPFTVNADFSWGAVTFDKVQYEPNDAVTATVALPRALQSGEKIVASLWDNYNRKIGSTTADVNGMTATVTFPAWTPVTILHRLRVELLRGGKTASSSDTSFPVRARLRHDDFNEIVWGSAENSPLTNMMLRKLAEQDETDVIDVGWRAATSARNIAAANMQALPYRDRFGPVGGDKDNVVSANEGNAYGCMRHALTLKALEGRMKEHALIHSAYGSFGYTNGDETIYSYSNPDLCWCPTCLHALRDELKVTYADLAALNADWGTTYATWNEVMPLTYKEAKETGAYARWVEHRLSSNRTFARFYAHSQQALRNAGDHGARAGFDGMGGSQMPNSGFDLWALTQQLDIIQAYANSDMMEIMRSFLRSGQISGWWYGSYGLADATPYSHAFPWESLFHGMNTTWFWTMGSPGPLSGYAPDLTSLPFMEARTQSLREIKRGIGKLLLAGERQHDGILIHYSEASRIADSLYKEKENDWSTEWLYAVWSINLALDDCGLSYNYLATPQLEAGALTQSGARVFIMSRSHAVSEKEAAEIRRFVEAGGIVLADIVPGMLNGHGTPQQTGMLAALYPTDDPNAVTNLGKGKALRYGTLLDGYGKVRRLDQHGWTEVDRRWEQLGALLQRAAGVTPPVVITAAEEKALPPTDISRFRCGEIAFIGLLRDYFCYDNDPYAARVRFPAKRHLYDVRAGKYLGLTDTLKTTIDYRAHLYALSPYKVEAVQVQLPTKGTAGVPLTGKVSLKVTGGTPSLHAFRLEVRDANGQALPWYAQNIIAEQGSCSFTIPWALSDAGSTYTVTVRDVMSGITVKRVCRF
jgi:hypothetical protein